LPDLVAAHFLAMVNLYKDLGKTAKKYVLWVIQARRKYTRVVLVRGDPAKVTGMTLHNNVITMRDLYRIVVGVTVWRVPMVP
jgi:hypothetical protein